MALAANIIRLRIAKAMIDLAHSLGLKAVAEGIETPSQRDLLQRSACEAGQGFLFSSALPPDQLAAYLQNRHCLATAGL